MRIVVLSDIHGNLSALEAVLDELDEGGGADKVWVLGDLAAFGPEPARSLARIRTIPNAAVISGNTDRYIVTGRRPKMAVADKTAWKSIQRSLVQRDAGFAWTAGQLDYTDYEYLRGLPPELRQEVDRFGRMIAFHGIPGDDETGLFPSTPDDVVLNALLDREGRLALCGHTHLPMDRQVGGWRVVNVGSVGLPFDGDRRASYVLLEFGANGALDVAFCRVEYDVEAVIRKLRAPNAPWVEKALRAARPPS
jgi:predicted phosphodiesterase